MRRLWCAAVARPSPTSTVFRAGSFVFYDLGFFSSLPALTCQVLMGCITSAGMRRVESVWLGSGLVLVALPVVLAGPFMASGYALPVSDWVSVEVGNIAQLSV